MSARARLAAAIVTIEAWTFIGIGAAFLIAPRAMAAVIAMDASVTITAAEMRTIYGGLEIGVGLAILGLVRRGDVRLVATALALLFGGMVVGRVTSLALDGIPTDLGLLLAALEGSGLIAALGARRLAAAR